MTVLSSDTRTALLAKKAEYEAILAEAMDALLANAASGKKSYKLDTTEGMQAVVNRSTKEQMELIESLEATIDHIDRRLNGKLNFNLNVRRKTGSALRRRGGGY